jgi:hypothetical protein
MQSYFLQVVLLHHAIGKIVDHLARPEKGSKGQSLAPSFWLASFEQFDDPPLAAVLLH